MSVRLFDSGDQVFCVLDLFQFILLHAVISYFLVTKKYILGGSCPVLPLSQTLK